MAYYENPNNVLFHSDFELDFYECNTSWSLEAGFFLQCFQHCVRPCKNVLSRTPIKPSV